MEPNKETESLSGTKPAIIQARRGLADWSRWLAYVALALAVGAVPITIMGSRLTSPADWRFMVAVGAALLAPVLAVAVLVCGYTARFKRHNVAARGDGVFVGWAVLLMTPFNLSTVPYSIPARINRSRTACEYNLWAIQQAKEQWAKEHHKQPTDIPTLEELAVTNNYIPAKIKCYDGGVYSLNSVTTPPTCSLNRDGHRLEPGRQNEPRPRVRKQGTKHGN